MFELTDQQREELSSAEPVAVDPKTGQAYVLVRQEAYERMKALLALDDYDPDEGAAYINEVMAEDDANDPYLDSYQKYGKQA
jgi:PHD/YefM family antitoxin component YafN of YafNO toxin-antitoxin module